MLHPYKMAAIAALLPYARNARTHSPEQIEQIAGSIREFGFITPVIVDGEAGIVAGHGRVEAAKVLGWTEVPTLEVRHLSEAQRKAFMLADNKIQLNAGWDADLLRVELSELADAGFELPLIGFSTEELAGLFDKTAGLTDPDDVPAAPAEPVAQLGDAWTLGRHRLVCGDNAITIEIALDGTNPDLLLTDPPYGINIVGGGKPVTIGKIGGGKITNSNYYLSIKGDDKPFDPAHIVGLAKNHILFGGNYFASRLKDSRCWIVWDKNNTGNFAECELAWSDFDKSAKIYHFTWNGLIREGLRSEELSKRIHPTQKPVGLFASILSDFIETKGNIFDPYIGSGTTLIACERTGHNCYGIEIEPAYVDVSIERWQAFTGETAMLDGKSFAEMKEERHGTTRPEATRAD